MTFSEKEYELKREQRGETLQINDIQAIVMVIFSYYQ